MNDRLQSSLHQLRLSGLVQSLDVRLQESDGHQLSHAEFSELMAWKLVTLGDVWKSDRFGIRMDWTCMASKPRIGGVAERVRTICDQAPRQT